MNLTFTCIMDTYVVMFYVVMGVSGGARVVRRMLFDADDTEPAVTGSRRLSLPCNISISAGSSHGRQYKTPTKCM